MGTLSWGRSHSGTLGSDLRGQRPIPEKGWIEVIQAVESS